METNNEARETKKNPQTPIIDGDARPDINLNPEDEQRRDHPIPTPNDKGKTTKNRVDTNSLEDFRDAK